MKASEVLERQLSSWGLHVEPVHEAKLLRYARLLADYDRANVIGTRDLDEIVERHVLDSLSCLLFAQLQEAQKVADVGSGGGLPGIPLAVVLPQTEITLFESVGKKASFLQYAVEELNLSNVRIKNERVEEAGRRDSHRCSYDVCTVRAVARLSVIAEYCLPLLRTGGHVVAMKGRQNREELAEGERAVRKLGGCLKEEMWVPVLPELEQRARRLVLLQKVSSTPGLYPRRVGTPARDPLGKN